MKYRLNVNNLDHEGKLYVEKVFCRSIVVNTEPSSDLDKWLNAGRKLMMGVVGEILNEQSEVDSQTTLQALNCVFNMKEAEVDARLAQAIHSVFCRNELTSEIAQIVKEAKEFVESYNRTVFEHNLIKGDTGKCFAVFPVE